MRPAVVVLFIVGLVLVLSIAVPPFQNPDEPQHLAAILSYSSEGADEAKTQARIIRLMDQNSWFQLLGMRRPAFLPERIEEVKFLVGNYQVASYRDLLNTFPVYHFLVGKVVGRLGRGDISSAYYLARLISLLLFGGALSFLFLAFRFCSGASPASRETSWLVAGFFFILFVPQFGVTSVAVNPDCLTIFLGAAFAYAAFALLLGRQKTIYYGLLFGSAMMGFVADRSLLVLLPLAGIGLVLSIDRKNYQRVIVLTLLAAVAVILLVYFTTVTFPLRMEKEFIFARGNIDRTLASLKSASPFALSEFNRVFLLKLADSFFLRFGWSAFVPAKAFSWAWRLLMGTAILGLGVFSARQISRLAKKRPQAVDPAGAPDEMKNPERQLSLGKLAAFSGIAVLLQALALRVVATNQNTYAQGRYFFPLIAPVAFLVMLGVKSFFDLFGEKRKAGIWAVNFVVVLELVFLTYALWNYIIPVFHLTLKSPHPGI